MQSRSRHALAGALSPAVSLLFGFALVTGLAGCGGLDPVAISEPATDPAQIFARLTLDRPMITMSTAAPYDTVTVTATAWNLAGEPLSDLVPTFQWSDSTAMVVTSDGVVHALHPATGIKLIAEVRLPGNVRHADTGYVDITSVTAPPRLAKLFFELAPSEDSLTRSVYASHTGHNPDINLVFTSPVYLFYSFFGPTPTIRMLDSSGNSISDVRVEVRGLDTTIANLGACVSGGVYRCFRTVGETIDANGVNPGQARMVVRATVYGVTMADTVVWHVVWPVLQTVYVETGLDGKPHFVPNELRLNPSGLVNWWNFTDDTVDVTFDDPANVGQPIPSDVCQLYIDWLDYSYGPGEHCGAGNILIPGPGGPAPDDPFWTGYAPSEILEARAIWTSQVRQFPVPGIYHFHSTRTGATGQIIVTNNPAGTFP